MRTNWFHLKSFSNFLKFFELVLKLSWYFGQCKTTSLFLIKKRVSDYSSNFLFYRVSFHGMICMCFELYLITRLQMTWNFWVDFSHFLRGVVNTQVNTKNHQYWRYGKYWKKEEEKTSRWRYEWVTFLKLCSNNSYPFITTLGVMLRGWVDGSET